MTGAEREAGPCERFLCDGGRKLETAMHACRLMSAGCDLRGAPVGEPFSTNTLPLTIVAG